MKSIISNRRILFIGGFIVFMFFSLWNMFSANIGLVENGKVDLTSDIFSQEKVASLDGYWEFYWDKLLTAEDFKTLQRPQIDCLIKVPGSWNDNQAGRMVYPNHGVATYRLTVKYPTTILDPALSIKTVSAAYKLYANGKLVIEVGKVSSRLSEFKGDYKQIIVDLPKDSQELELIFQVANLDYIRGGLRDSVKFGSKQILEQQKSVLLSTQLLIIGVVFGLGLYYFILFILQKKNKTTLIFSILCFITALRAFVWGETPIMLLFPKMPVAYGILINYLTAYNLIPLIILFVISLYPLDYKRNTVRLILLPTLIFNVFLLAPAGLRASLNQYLYIIAFAQMIYILLVLGKAVIRKRENSLLMLSGIGIFILAIISDIFCYQGVSRINLSYTFLYGNLLVIIVMSYIQSRQQANINEQLILYNASLIEAARLKDKIMATEMSFLQAQIKPHFLYNALSAIANVSEKDGKKASKLIMDLALYLRKSLEFNLLNKVASLDKELEFVDTYFNIEQARFGEKIHLRKEIEVQLNFQIPVLILQPLVENAVRHGISKKRDGGIIIVRIKRIEEGVCFEIEDDGVGIEAHKLEILLSEDRKNEGVGLINIHHRLLRLFGRGLEIKSKPGIGTWVRLEIPEGRKSS